MFVSLFSDIGSSDLQQRISKAWKKALREQEKRTPPLTQKLPNPSDDWEVSPFVDFPLLADRMGVLPRHVGARTLGSGARLLRLLEQFGR